MTKVNISPCVYPSVSVGLDVHMTYLCNRDIFDHHPGRIESKHGPDSQLCRKAVDEGDEHGSKQLAEEIYAAH
jgi:hypothetical protein